MPLETTVTTDRTQYSASRAVEILVRMTNNSRASVAYRVANRFEYEIRVRESRSRRIVWTWSKGKTPPAPFSVQLMPGQWRQHLELWDGRDDTGKRVPAGVYEIEATHVPENRSDTIQIAINDRGGEGPGSGGGGNVMEPLQGVLRAEKLVAKPGESLRLSYLVSNRGKETLTVSFASGKQFEIEAYQSSGARLWAHTQEQAYLQMLTRLTLAPGETRTLASVWRIGAAPEGIVTLSAYLTSSQGALAKANSQITIKK